MSGESRSGQPALVDKREFDPEALSSTAMYKILAGCIVPRPIGFLSTVSREGIFNAAPFSFFNGISHIPPLVCVSISRVYRTDAPKDTLVNVLQTRDFVANVVDESIARAQDLCSEELPPDIDEIAHSGLTAAPSRLVKAPRIDESPVNFECRLTQTVELDGSPYTLLIGRVVYVHVRADLVQEDGRIDAARLRAVGRMTGNTYTRTRELFTLDHDTFDVMPKEPMT